MLVISQYLPCFWFIYSPGIKYGNWKSPRNGGFNGKINYEWWIFHCHVWLPEGKYIGSLPALNEPSPAMAHWCPANLGEGFHGLLLPMVCRWKPAQLEAKVIAEGLRHRATTKSQQSHCMLSFGKGHLRHCLVLKKASKKQVRALEEAFPIGTPWVKIVSKQPNKQASKHTGASTQARSGRNKGESQVSRRSRQQVRRKEKQASDQNPTKSSSCRSSRKKQRSSIRSSSSLPWWLPRTILTSQRSVQLTFQCLSGWPNLCVTSGSWSYPGRLAWPTISWLVSWCDNSRYL